MHLRRCTTDETVMRHDERNETLSRCYAMSWEDVRARFPYGLPASGAEEAPPIASNPK
jgi:hypothetical protein